MKELRGPSDYDPFASKLQYGLPFWGEDPVGEWTSARFRKPLGDRCRRALEFESAGGGFSLVWFIYIYIYIIYTFVYAHSSGW
jgi:hypothetical protein